VVPALAVAMVVLLGGGVLAVTTVDRQTTTVAADGRVAPVGLGDASLVEDEAATVSVAPPVSPPNTTATTAPSTTASTTSSTRPSTTTTTSAPRTGATTTVSAGTSVTTPPASSWRAENEGVSARMRMEPAAPVAGQPVRFFVDFSGELACCQVVLHFGDDTSDFRLNMDGMCQGPSPLSPGAHSTVATHTYAKPGAYRVWLQVLDGDICTLPPNPAPGDPIPLHNLDVRGCISVGPRSGADGGCEPAPNPFPLLPPPR
jgi:hypothetical protein